MAFVAAQVKCGIRCTDDRQLRRRQKFHRKFTDLTDLKKIGTYFTDSVYRFGHGYMASGNHGFSLSLRRSCTTC
jgi:hypothetical protein